MKNNLPKSYDSLIKNLLHKYENEKKPIEISFRKIVQDFNVNERVNHLIHPYPAKLLPHIPFFFINNTVFSKSGDIVFDPFCGSGTVILESILGNRSGIGVDINPLATLISEIKTSVFSTRILGNYKSKIQKQIIATKGVKDEIPNKIELEYWFYPGTLKKLSIIKSQIETIKNLKYKKFFYLCFSSCLRKVSLADPRVSVPVRLKKNQYPAKHPLRLKSNEYLNSLKNKDIYKVFFKIVDENIERVKSYRKLVKTNNYTSRIFNLDIKNLNDTIWGKNIKPKKNKVDLIITSPPYAGAQKYIRSSRLSLYWLEELLKTDLKEYDAKTIGRENYKKKEYEELVMTCSQEANTILTRIKKINPLRAQIAAKYLSEMEYALKRTLKYLKKEGYLILVIGNNNICSFEFETQKYISEILCNLGMIKKLELIDEIKSYGLMTKRNKTASIITREWVLIYQKK